MDESDDIVRNINDGTRKKQKKDRIALKNRKYKYIDNDPLALEFEDVCDHNKGKFKCRTLTTPEIVYNRKLLYEKKGKNTQDVYLMRLISPCPTERIRSRLTSSKPQKNRYFVTYFLVRDSKRVVKVCKAFFLAALGLSKNRVSTIATKIFEGQISHDNRGGDRKSSKSNEKKDSVRSFISSLRAKESHYNRRKSKRIYLSYELNIRKLWNMYNNSVSDELKVKESMFRRVFENEFNIGFSPPSCDICSTCEMLKNQQKVEQRPEEIQSLKTQLRVHKIEAKRFFALAKETPEKSFTVCFDLQQIQVLPKTPIQESYYLRQVGFYSLCVTDMPTKNPHFYTWTENQAKKGSSEVASALLSYLLSADLTGIEVLRLFCDGCGGQNKNSYVVHMLIFWLHNYAPENVVQIVMTFPVRGHSFLPADRVFGRIEKDLRKKQLILNPTGYYDVYEKHGKVHKLGENWYLLNVKQLDTYYKKVENIRDAKRILIERKATLIERKEPKTRNTRRSARSIAAPNIVLTHIKYGVKVSNFYNAEYPENALTLLKPSQIHPTLLRRLTPVNEISIKKKDDVSKILLKQFGENWRQDPELEWFQTNIFCTISAATASQARDDNNSFDEVTDDSSLL